jgi:uracil-DNA glycosylase family 4
VVKHFKWEPRGKRRIHKKPRHSEVQACRVWLDAEIAQVKPLAIVALGATAAHAVIGPDAKVTRDRTKPFPSPLAPLVTLTVHPSSILRAPDSDTRAAERAHFVDDLRWKAVWFVNRISRATGRRSRKAPASPATTC